MERLTFTIDCWDKYRDVRKIFLTSYSDNCTELHYPMVFACNSDISDENLPGELLICDEKSTDSSRQLAAVLTAKTKYVLLIVEDAIFLSKVEKERIEDILDYMDRSNIAFCKLYAVPNKKGKRVNGLKNAKYINKRQAYGINYLCGIYRKDYLLSILNSGCKDSWEIEEMLLKNARLSKKGYYYDKIVVLDNPLNVIFGVEKGKWVNKAVRVIKKRGYKLDGSRKVWSMWHDFLSFLKNRATSFLPIKVRYAMKKILQKIGMKFATKE